MCGIAGIWAPEGNADGCRLLPVLQAMAHRGPDGCALWIRREGALGQQRLALHDLSPNGLQPFLDRNSNLVLVANGTLHNGRALRHEEQQRGAVFTSQSDLEVILPLYKRFGKNFVERLEGPFALALLDRARGQLLLARDRLGQKPLYYTRLKGGLLFSSELAALARALPTRTLLPERAVFFLQAGYLPAPLSLLAEARQLPPACRLILDGRGVALERYWTPPLPEERPRKLSEVAQALEEGLTSALQPRLHCDRPVGLCLSGGLDSAALLLLSEQALGHPIPTFSMGFDEPAWDERAAAASTARALGAPHTSYGFDVEPGPYLQRLVALSGEALADPSFLAAARLFELAKGEAEVFLSGEGGDELLLGYRRHALCALLARLPQKLPLQILSPLAHLAPGATSRRALAALRGGGVASVLADLEGLLPASRLREELQTGLLPDPDPLSRHLGSLGPFPAHGGAAAGRMDLLSYLPGDLLAKGERAAMAQGVEVWSPFLHPPLVDLLSALPGNLRQGGRRGKLPLRKLLAGRVPGALLARPKKGFGVPLEDWLRRGSYGRFARELLGDCQSPFENLLKGKSALPLLERLQGGEEGLGLLVHACVVLALFQLEIVEGAYPGPRLSGATELLEPSINNSSQGPPGDTPTKDREPGRPHPDQTA